MEIASILIPCYNDEEYVGAAIESALNQTWPNCEIIVVDDGSDDDSCSVAQRYESEGVQVILQENKGAQSARNRALRVSTGDYVQYLDADDLLHPRKIEAQISALQSCPERTVAVCSTVYFQDGASPEDGRWAEGVDQIPWLTSEDPVKWLINLWAPGTGWGMVQTGGWLVPRPVAEEAGPWDECITRDQDGEYFARVVLSSDGVQYVEDGCVYYRQYAETARVSKRVTKGGLEGWLLAIDSKRDHLMPQVSGEDRDRAVRGLARQYWSLALSAHPMYPGIAETAESRAAALGFPKCLRSVSQNGWKGRVASAVTNTLGWRAARWVQWTYHRGSGTVSRLFT